MFLDSWFTQRDRRRSGQAGTDAADFSMSKQSEALEQRQLLTAAVLEITQNGADLANATLAPGESVEFDIKYSVQNDGEIVNNPANVLGVLLRWDRTDFSLEETSVYEEDSSGDPPQFVNIPLSQSGDPNVSAFAYLAASTAFPTQQQIFGDLDDDGEVTTQDASLLLGGFFNFPDSVLEGLRGTNSTATGAQIKANFAAQQDYLDFDNNGEVGTQDASLMIAAFFEFPSGVVDPLRGAANTPDTRRSGAEIVAYGQDNFNNLLPVTLRTIRLTALPGFTGNSAFEVDFLDGDFVIDGRPIDFLDIPGTDEAPVGDTLNISGAANGALPTFHPQDGFFAGEDDDSLLI